MAVNNSILGSHPWTDVAINNSRALDAEYARKLYDAKRMQEEREAASLQSEHYRMKLIAMRLRIPEGNKLPYQDLFTSLAGDKVFVFVVQDGQAVTLEDTATMFPSDQLITQLRLLNK
jgi:hypothetical protein